MRILAEHLDGLERSNFCDFDKPPKGAYQKGNKQKERPSEMNLWKRAGCHTETKAFEKSIVERIDGEPGLGLRTEQETEFDLE